MTVDSKCQKLEEMSTKAAKLGIDFFLAEFDFGVGSDGNLITSN